MQLQRIRLYAKKCVLRMFTATKCKPNVSMCVRNTQIHHWGAKPKRAINSVLCEDLDLEDLKYQEKNSREETESYSKDRETHSLEHTSKYLSPHFNYGKTNDYYAFLLCTGLW